MTTAISARVLVTAPLPSAAGARAAGLAPHGLEVSTAPGDEAALAAARRERLDAIVIDAAGRAGEDAAGLARALREAAAPRRPALLAVMTEPPAVKDGLAFDAVLLAPAFEAQIAARVQQLMRLGVMEDEARLRAQTLAAHGGRARRTRAPNAEAAIEALYIGAPSRDFLAIHRAIDTAGGALSASFSTFAGFDFLHEKDFDAVILNALGDDDGAFTICAALRRNTRLFHVPALLLVDLERFDRAEEAFARGASDLLPADASHAAIMARLTGLTRERRRREQLRAGFTALRAPEVTDADTGLATPAFFLDHLQRAAERAHDTSRPLSLLVLRAEAPRDVDRDARAAAYRQLGGMMRRLVRVEDLAARLEVNVYAIAMPGCTLDAAGAAAERLEAVGECTAFEGGDELDDPFQMTLHASVGALQPGESGRALLIRTVDRFHAKAPAKAV